MKKLLYLTLILVICGLGYLKWQSYRAGDMSAPTPSPSPSPVQTTPMMTFKKLETPYFTLEYAPEATVSSYSSPDSETWAVSYMGEAQRKSGRTQTELWDGYSYSVTRFEVAEASGSARVQAQVDRNDTIDACGTDRVTDLREVTFGQRQALSFSGGCVSDATNYYLLEAGALYRISMSNIGDQTTEPLYADALDAITASLHFLK